METIPSAPPQDGLERDQQTSPNHIGASWNGASRDAHSSSLAWRGTPSPELPKKFQHLFLVDVQSPSTQEEAPQTCEQEEERPPESYLLPESSQYSDGGLFDYMTPTALTPSQTFRHLLGQDSRSGSEMRNVQGARSEGWNCGVMPPGPLACLAGTPGGFEMPSPATVIAERTVVQHETRMESLRRKCLRLITERQELQRQRYDETTAALQQSLENDILRRTNAQLLARLEATEEQLLEAFRDDRIVEVVKELAQTKVALAEAHLEILTLQMQKEH